MWLRIPRGAAACGPSAPVLRAGGRAVLRRSHELDAVVGPKGRGLWQAPAGCPRAASSRGFCLATFTRKKSPGNRSPASHRPRETPRRREGGSCPSPGVVWSQAGAGTARLGNTLALGLGGFALSGGFSPTGVAARSVRGVRSPGPAFSVWDVARYEAPEHREANCLAGCGGARWFRVVRAQTQPGSGPKGRVARRRVLASHSALPLVPGSSRLERVTAAGRDGCRQAGGPVPLRWRPETTPVRTRRRPYGELVGADGAGTSAWHGSAVPWSCPVLRQCRRLQSGCFPTAGLAHLARPYQAAHLPLGPRRRVWWLPGRSVTWPEGFCLQPRVLPVWVSGFSLPGSQFEAALKHVLEQKYVPS